MLEAYQSEQKEIQAQIYDILWHMRGGISREEGFSLTRNERLIIAEQMASRMKNVEKTGLALL